MEDNVVEDLTSEEYAGDLFTLFEKQLEKELEAVSKRDEHKKKADEIFAKKGVRRCAAEPTKKIPAGCSKFHPDHKLYWYEGQTYCGPHVQALTGMAPTMFPVYHTSPKKNSPTRTAVASSPTTTTTTTTTSSTRPNTGAEDLLTAIRRTDDEFVAERRRKAEAESEAKRRREFEAESEARAQKIIKLEETFDTRFASLESKLEKMQTDIAVATAKMIKQVTEAQFNQFMEMLSSREQVEDEDEIPLTTTTTTSSTPPPPPAPASTPQKSRWPSMPSMPSIPFSKS